MKSLATLFLLAMTLTFPFKELGLKPLQGERCTSSIQCSGVEQCLNGVCQPRNPASECSPSNSCPLGEECVGGSCQAS